MLQQQKYYVKKKKMQKPKISDVVQMNILVLKDNFIQDSYKQDN